jgi:hypothetical protein
MNLNQIPGSLVSAYTKSSKYWDTSSAEIVEIANNLKDENKTVSQNAYEAYKFVLSNLDYDFNLVKGDYIDRKGALSALIESENNGCMEFTDLFISIARAMGIPARQLSGYAISSDTGPEKPLSLNLKGGDLLHSWAEFYDPAYGWIPVDPTWGDTSGIDYFTKLDTNHFVFTINGTNPVFPLPAGNYKTDAAQKYVEVGISEQGNDKEFVPKVEILADNSPTIDLLKIKDGYLKYKIINTGKTVVYLKELTKKFPILPGKKAKILLPSYDPSVRIVDATNKEYKFSADPQQVAVNRSRTYTIVAFAAMLGLCMTFYVSLIRPRVRKTPIGLLRPLLQVLGRLPNQH